MKRLTVHLKNVAKVNQNGKVKLFNTLTFKVKTGSEKEVQSVLSNVGEVKSHYLSNITA